MRQLTDRLPILRADPTRDELNDLGCLVDDAERCVLSRYEFAYAVDNQLKNLLGVKDPADSPNCRVERLQRRW
jgi:hypothetical protein